MLLFFVKQKQNQKMILKRLYLFCGCTFLHLNIMGTIPELKFQGGVKSSPKYNE